jgi:hypothetical protein
MKGIKPLSCPRRLLLIQPTRSDTQTVQLSIRNAELAECLAKLLSQDGDRRVFLVEQPSSRLDGVVVMDEWGFANFGISNIPVERIVLILSKVTTRLSRICDIGIQTVVIEEDSLEMLQLAIVAAELRLKSAAHTN